MEIDKNFLEKWKYYYVKMIEDAYKIVVKDFEKDCRYYKSLGLPEKKGLAKFNRKLLSTVFRLDENFWADIEEDRLHNPAGIITLAGEIAKANPEYAKKQDGLDVFATGLETMQGSASLSSNKWLLRVLRDFCEIYQKNPNINDMDAMIEFMKVEKVVKSIDRLDSIPNDVRQSLDLNLDENLNRFVQQYASTYAKADEITFGGKRL